MTERIAAASWLKASATRAVMAALDAAQVGASRFVGGCVRNAVMGRSADDIDIATQLIPEAVVAAVEAAGLKAVPTGIEHGTVTVVAQGRGFEVTTLRRDVETDGRRAVVAFTQDWAEDAARRDFRLNALYADGEGRVFDPTGGGIEDARAGRVIFVGDAETRIREDYLRILRFFRFSAWYGRGALDPVGLAACGRLAPGMAGLSVERIWKELKKLLAADDPRPAVAAMAAAGCLAAAAPEASELARFARLVETDVEILFTADPMQRLAALLPDQVTGAGLAQRLKLSGVERDRLIAALGTEERIVSWMSLRELRRALYRIGPEAFVDRARLAWASSENPRQAAQWRALLALAQGWTRPVLPLTGAEVVAAGVAPGPLVGRVMREVEAWWIDADFTDDKLSVVERLKAVAQGMG